MILYVDKVLQRTARKLSDRQLAALALLTRLGCAQPGRHIAARTLRSLRTLGLVQPTGSTATTFTLTASGRAVARIVQLAA